MSKLCFVIDLTKLKKVMSLLRFTWPCPSASFCWTLNLSFFYFHASCIDTLKVSFKSLPGPAMYECNF